MGLTRQAEDSVTEIALWTFGPVQAEAYETELLACCETGTSSRGGRGAPA